MIIAHATVSAYYNEIDRRAAAWLRELIRAGLIAPGDVDERDIRDVRPDDLRGYDQHHFFAGIGVWSYALRLAGWPDDEPVWTGSCPCQPFSAAGSRAGFADERHLWPSWFHLIRECAPSVVFGEQVASAAGLEWFDLVSADLEGEAYAVAAADLCAAGVGAPHIRQRLFWVAYAARRGRREFGDALVARSGGYADGGVVASRLADSSHERHERGGGARRRWPGPQNDGTTRRLADADGGHASAERQQRGGQQRQLAADCGAGSMGSESGSPGPSNGFWRAADWLYCRDGKWRPVEPGAFPLAHGAPARVGRLRGYGNAIVAPLARQFIEAAREAMNTA